MVITIHTDYSKKAEAVKISLERRGYKFKTVPAKPGKELACELPHGTITGFENLSRHLLVDLKEIYEKLRRPKI